MRNNRNEKAIRVSHEVPAPPMLERPLSKIAVVDGIVDVTFYEWIAKGDSAVQIGYVERPFSNRIKWDDNYALAAPMTQVLGSIASVIGESVVVFHICPDARNRRYFSTSIFIPFDLSVGDGGVKIKRSECAREIVGRATAVPLRFQENSNFLRECTVYPGKLEMEMTVQHHWVFFAEL